MLNRLNAWAALVHSVKTASVQLILLSHLSLAKRHFAFTAILFVQSKLLWWCVCYMFFLFASFCTINAFNIQRNSSYTFSSLLLIFRSGCFVLQLTISIIYKIIIIIIITGDISNSMKSKLFYAQKDWLSND